MDSLLLLCARHVGAGHVVTQRRLSSLPADLYLVLFQLAFLDGRPCVLRDLVASWPFPVLHVQQLVRRRELLGDRSCSDYIQAIIQAVVAQLRRELEEPGSDSRCQLRVLDMTGVPDDPFGLRISLTKALAKACVEVSNPQQELQRHQPKRRKGRSGATTTPPQLRGVDVHTDLYVKRSSYEILHKAIQIGAAGPLRIKCREFQASDDLSAFQIATLLQSLDPSCLRRVHLQYVSFGLLGLSEIMQHLSRFPELRSLVIPLYNLHMHPLTLELANRIRSVARKLGMLPRLRELNLRSTRLSGNLRRFLCNIQTPLESLDLHNCSLVPDDLAFVSQSFHAPALKRLDLRLLNVPQGLLEPLLLLLERASASLLYLDLSECHIADSHLAVLLPTLLRCSRLRFLGLYGNFLSTAAIKDLLQKTLELPNLHQVFYPIPDDCGRPEPSDFRMNFVPDEERLATAKAEFSQILANSGRTDLVWTHDRKDLKVMDYFSL